MALEQHDTRHNKEELLVIKKKRRVICNFACQAEDSKPFSDDNEVEDVVPVLKECPICFKSFPTDQIVIHSSSCSVGESDTASLNTFLPVKEELDYICLEIKKNNTNWNISVIRNKFISTTMDQFEEANEEDWLKPIKVRFIGEDGIDAGGLTREFMSLLFEKSPIFEDSSLSLNPQLLEAQHYLYMGRITSIPILEGHPGPRRFNRFLVDFILLDKIPQFSLVDKNEIKRADALAAIEEIENCTDDNIKAVFDNCLDILCTTGFEKNLNTTNKQEAVTAIKAHFLLYRSMPSIMQYLQGPELSDDDDSLESIESDRCQFQAIGLMIDMPEKLDLEIEVLDKTDTPASLPVNNAPFPALNSPLEIEPVICHPQPNDVPFDDTRDIDYEPSESEADSSNSDEKETKQHNEKHGN